MTETNTESQAEIEVAPLETEVPALDAGTEPAAPAAPSPEEAEAAETEKRRKDAQASVNKRIAQEVAKRHEAERRAKAFEELLAAKTGTPVEALPTDPAELQRLVNSRAAELAQSEAARMTHAAAFNERCNEVAALGREIPSFSESVANLQAMGVMRPESDFIQSVVAMKDAAKILDHLGQHPDLAAEIADAPMHKMAARLADIASEVNKPPKISRAPTPAKPIGTNATPQKPTKLSEARSDKEWLEIRREQKKARFAR